MNLNHVALTISKPGEIGDFYHDILGMEEIKRVTLKKELSGKIFSIEHDTKVVLMKKDNLVFELFLWNYKEKDSYDHICISFKNREAIITKALQKLYNVIRIEREKFDLIFIRDKSGNIFEIKENA